MGFSSYRKRGIIYSCGAYPSTGGAHLFLCTHDLNKITIEEKRREGESILPPKGRKHLILGKKKDKIQRILWAAQILPINRNPSSSLVSFRSQLDQISTVRVSLRFSKWLVLQFSQSYVLNVTGYCFISIEPLKSPAQYDSYVSSEYCYHYICRIFCCFPSVIVGNYNNLLK